MMDELRESVKLFCLVLGKKGRDVQHTLRLVPPVQRQVGAVIITSGFSLRGPLARWVSMHTVIRDHSLKYDRRGEHNYQKAFRPDPSFIISELQPAHNCQQLTFVTCLENQWVISLSQFFLGNN